MRILLAEDDRVSRRLLEITLERWGHEVVSCANGDDAWGILDSPGTPVMAILDWMMPGAGGPEICRRIRQRASASPPYIILLTTKSGAENIVAGLRAGADDYLTKPFNMDELHARVQVGVRIVALQRSLADRVAELEAALSREKRLQGLLPICAYCKKIRDDGNYWQQVETYITEHSDACFSHGICPDCFDRVMRLNFEPAKP